MQDKRKVIIVTDGDYVAAKTLQVVAERVGGTCISESCGNPTVLKGEEILELIKKAKREPVLVMVDDRGKPGKGKGESVLEYLMMQPEIEILGVVAVAANSDTYHGIEVDFSIDKDGHKVDGPVDKHGLPEEQGHQYLEGDTVEILQNLKVPIIVGTGDTGKMQGRDAWQHGAKITTQAVKEILARSGENAARQ